MKFRVGHALPELRRVDFALPIVPRLVFQNVVVSPEEPSVGGSAEFAPPETPHRAFHPAQQMNAVGDVADGHFVNGLSG